MGVQEGIEKNHFKSEKVFGKFFFGMLISTLATKGQARREALDKSVKLVRACDSSMCCHSI